MVPAAHTDLIVSALGEQGGFLAILGLFLMYGIIVYRGLRIALRAPGAYSYFLVTGLTLITAYQILLITGGMLGLVPLSGVVSPFLSYGRTSMVANFALIAIILAVSTRSGSDQPERNFGAGSRILAAALALLMVPVIGNSPGYRSREQTRRSSAAA